MLLAVTCKGARCDVQRLSDHASLQQYTINMDYAVALFIAPVAADDVERGHHSSFSLESMGSRNPSAPSLVAFRHGGPEALTQGIWPAALALFLSVSTSILVFPFFPYVPTSGYFGDALPQVRTPTP